MIVNILALSIIAYNNSIISYNYTNGFPNYAAVVGAHNHTRCGCYTDPKWKNGINYTCEDWAGLPNYHWQLIPGICEMNSVVPMSPLFSNGPWRKAENHLRKRYGKYLTFRGCDFNDTSIITKTNKSMKVSTGCYWVVINSTLITYRGELLDYGYVTGSAKKLPWWVQIETAPMDIVEYPLGFPGGIMIVICSAISLVVFLSSLIR